jgi:hypothetical protein
MPSLKNIPRGLIALKKIRQITHVHEPALKAVRSSKFRLALYVQHVHGCVWKSIAAPARGTI